MIIALVALGLTLALTLLAPAAGQRVSAVHNATWYEAELDIVPRKTYPACAYDIHSLVNTPRMWYITGQNGTNAAAITSDGWLSTDGFDTSAANVHLTADKLVTGEPIPVRRAGSAVYLANGNLVLLTGKTTNNVLLQHVYYSSDSGVSWRASPVNTNAMWSPRSDATVCSMPNTNTIFLASGVSAAGQLNDVWISSDGVGGQWRSIQSSGFGNGYQSGSCVGLYDSSYVSPIYNTPNSTIIVVDNDSAFYISTNLGATFRGYLAPWPDRNFMVVVADRDNYVYVMGGQNVVNNNVYFTSDKGQTWEILGFINTFGLGDLYWQGASTSCGAIHIRQIDNVWYKTLTVYGGTITLAASDTSVAAYYGAIHGRLSLPYQSLVGWTPSVPSSSSGVSSASSSSTPQIVYVETEVSKPGQTSVGLTVGMAFLGLGVGVIVAVCVALLCQPRNGKTGHSKFHEPSVSNANREMELSAVEN